MKSEYIKIPRRILEEVIHEAQMISTADKAEGFTNSAEAYARALGRCNGGGKIILASIEHYLEVSK